MSKRLFAVAFIAASVAIHAAGQDQPVGAKRTPNTAKRYTPPRTPDGQPDLQGVWNYSVGTPLERPDVLKGILFLTDDALAAAQKRVAEGSRDLRQKPGTDADVRGDFNEFWDGKRTMLLTRRTSLITDPPDGKLPSLTPEAQTRRAARAEARRQRGPADSWEDRNLQERCIASQTLGPPMLPTYTKDELLGYLYHFQIVQSPSFVVILSEVFQEIRLVPLDGRPHLVPTISQWLGDSRGHFEGDTLVIDTTNFAAQRFSIGSAGDVEVDEHLHLVERFTRTSANRIDYQFTVEDPTTWTKTWSAAIPIAKTEGAIYSYECHEGNHSLPNILSGARAQEKAAADVAKKGSR